ncbi:MAG: gamma-glutamylcyclotransferase [Victivallales bacterium]|nr:gamma-glutamylcyclotransferase [Victivallales bacterium]
MKKSHIHTSEQLTRAFRAARGNAVDLFAYGTLTNEKYLRLLINRNVRSDPAVLYNFMCISPSWSFPFIVKQRGAKTTGKILRDITVDELKILDDFEHEGNMYYRRPVVVRTGDLRQRCQTYIGNITAINSNISPGVFFEDRYIWYVEKKIDSILADVETNRPGLDRRVLHELMSSAVDSIIQSHFDGNYVCGYIMMQALEEAAPPRLVETLKNQELLPYAGNYMRLACQHIVFNQFVDKIRHEHPESLRVSQQYFQHGMAVLLAVLLYNRKKKRIDTHFKRLRLDEIVGGRGYRDYAKCAIDVADIEYDSSEMDKLIMMLHDHWTHNPTPLGAELEFSNLGARAVYAKPGEDPVYDGFNWFWDFDMVQRTWKLGGHIDSHRQISLGHKRHRGFLEYALGRFQILGDLSRPLFDCPWAMSLLINELVKFLDVMPHSLHISMELNAKHRNISSQPHDHDDIACLLLLGGDFQRSVNNIMREWRIFNNELDTNFEHSLHFSDRKYHFAKPDQSVKEASEVMEYKFIRLHKTQFDYETLISTLKGYQLHTHARPLKNTRQELPEQIFLRHWAERPEPLAQKAIDSFVEKVSLGLTEEIEAEKPSTEISRITEKLHKTLCDKNSWLESELNTR